MSDPREFGAVFHNATCARCGRSWTKTLQGFITCPHCTGEQRRRSWSDMQWVVFWAFMLGCAAGTFVTLSLYPTPEPAPLVEVEDGR